MAKTVELIGFHSPYLLKGLPMSAPATDTIDVRTIPPYERHALIFGRFDALSQGGSLQLVNDHDPAPLHHQFDARSPGQFQWTYLEQGPQQWRVQITKLVPITGADSCCSGGACCG